jgi:hypothetical protein
MQSASVEQKDNGNINEQVIKSNNHVLHQDICPMLKFDEENDGSDEAMIIDIFDYTLTDAEGSRVTYSKRKTLYIEPIGFHLHLNIVRKSVGT